MLFYENYPPPPAHVQFKYYCYGWHSREWHVHFPNKYSPTIIYIYIIYSAICRFSYASNRFLKKKSSLEKTFPFQHFAITRNRSSLILPFGSGRNSHSDGMEDEGRLLRERDAFHRRGWLVAALFQTNDCSLTTSGQATRQVYINCSSDNTGWIRFIRWIKLGYGQQGGLINNVLNNRYSLHVRVSIFLIDSTNISVLI